MTITRVGAGGYRHQAPEKTEVTREIEAAYAAGMAARNPLPARRPVLPLSACPYVAGTQLANYWRSGWLEADRNYGSTALWPVVPLPPVSEETEAEKT